MSAPTTTDGGSPIQLGRKRPRAAPPCVYFSLHLAMPEGIRLIGRATYGPFARTVRALERFDELTRTQVIAVLSGVGACCCQIDFYVSLGSEDIDRR